MSTCGERHVFPRDRFSRVRRAEVWCDQPNGHDGEHQAVKGRTAFVWQLDECQPAGSASGTRIVDHT